MPRNWPTPVRLALLLLAVLSLGVGIVGIFVPGLPTTVFVLISAWAAARSSSRFHHWLESHRLFGRMLRNWRQHGSISRAAKWGASISMSLCAVILFLTARPWTAWIAVTVMAVVLAWIWSRPLPPATNESRGE